MKIALVAAVAENGVIGRGNDLPWYLPQDLRHFKQLTLGKPVVMGRKTWESIGRPLPGRTNIVVTRRAGYRAEGARVVGSIADALSLAESIGEIDGSDELMVIGGADIYALALPLAQRMYLTEVHAAVAGDVLFPDWSREQWREVRRERHQGDEMAFSFVTYERR